MNFELYVDYVNYRVAQRQRGTVTTVPDLMGPRWEEVPDAFKQAFGKAFSRYVGRGIIRGLEFAYVNRSPHITMWRVL
jgi:hypothetical protein